MIDSDAAEGAAASRRLPTPAEMLQRAQAALDRALSALSDARDELASDWPPGSRMTSEQADQRERMYSSIALAKSAINASRR